MGNSLTRQRKNHKKTQNGKNKDKYKIRSIDKVEGVEGVYELNCDIFMYVYRRVHLVILRWK